MMLLHQKIENGGGAGIKVDGIFGPETLKALKRVQGYHPELKVDGLAGDRTLAVLGLLTTDTFNDPQLPATKKGINQSRRTDWKVSPEETRQALANLQHAYSHPIELTAGRAKPLRLLSLSAIAEAFPHIGVGQRALYNIMPSEYEEELISLLPKEHVNQLDDEDLQFIQQQLIELEKQDPQKAKEYKEFLKKNLDTFLIRMSDNVFPNVQIKDPTNPDDYFLQLASQIPVLQGFYLTQDEYYNILDGRAQDHAIFFWDNDNKLKYSTKSPLPLWRYSTGYANKPFKEKQINGPAEVKFHLKHGGRIDYINLYK